MAVPSGSAADRIEDPAVLSTGLPRTLAAHSLAGHRVHQLGPVLLTITLDAAHARALAVLLAAQRELPRQAPTVEDESSDAQGWPKQLRHRSR
ncbi:hypothetical protein [Streptomyces sp. NPDC056491]|uniref:hypothetical protein n=1 Tax=Streptomyces sp. NPDC056491 TaxID=3345837 RepID=UPI00367C3A4D